MSLVRELGSYVGGSVVLEHSILRLQSELKVQGSHRTRQRTHFFRRSFSISWELIEERTQAAKL